MLLRVLIAVAPAALANRLRRLLEGAGVVLTMGRRSPRLWDHLPRGDVDLVLVSRALLGSRPGAAIESVRQLPEHPEVIVVSEIEDAESRAALLAAGCMAVVYQHLPERALGETLKALIRRRQDDALRRLREAAGESQAGLDDFVAESDSMRRFLDVARRVVASDSSLLIIGETGTGKERAARAIHADGPRGKGPFIAVNCGALPESLLESELFGHEEGAFTGASRPHRGYFEIAHGGTLFLDEIGELPLHLQVKLLRVLQERTIMRVGSERPLVVNVRVMAATNKNLELETKARRFRPDLYYRLAVVTLTVPALRERRQDIPRLTGTYLARFRAHLGRPVQGLSGGALDALAAYEWPGNVRELINVLERAVLLTEGPEIGLADLPPGVAGLAAGPAAGADHPLVADARQLTADWLDRPLREVRDRLADAAERHYLAEVLEATCGRIGETARRSGLSERTLYALMRRHGLRKEQFRRERRRR